MAAGRLRVGADGWVAGLRRLASPNFDARPPGCAVDLLVLHNISLPPGCYGGGHVQQLFCNALPVRAHPYFAGIAGLQVSAHFLIERDGTTTQFVSTLDRAWHAGASQFLGRSRCNDFSIGIELEGDDFTPFEDAQYAALAGLLPALTAALPLAYARGHSDIAPGRKTDPGPHFDWRRLPLLARLYAAGT